MGRGLWSSRRVYRNGGVLGGSGKQAHTGWGNRVPATGAGAWATNSHEDSGGLGRAIWKNSIAVVQTLGDPPNSGSAIFVNIGWTENRRNALTKMVRVNTAGAAMAARPALNDMSFASWLANFVFLYAAGIPLKQQVSSIQIAHRRDTNRRWRFPASINTFSP